MVKEKNLTSLNLLNDICYVSSGLELGLKIDGKTPNAVAFPDTEESVAQVLELASNHKIPLAIQGSGSMFERGTPLSDLDWLLSTARLKDEPILNTKDLNIVTKAGVPLLELQTLLARNNLFLPIDHKTPQSTIGGVLADGGGGSQRLQYGLVRDFVLGMKVALTDGKVYHFGGQTVKNVAGYDVSKVFIGSKGTLGVITEVTLRVYPIPPQSQVLLATGKTRDQVWEVAREIQQLAPAVIEIYDMTFAKVLYDLGGLYDNDFLLLVKFTGPGPAVEKQVQDSEITMNYNQMKILKRYDKFSEEAIWSKRFFIDNQHNKVNVKISVPRRHLLRIAQEIDGAGRKFKVDHSAMFSPAVGLGWVNFNGADWEEFLKKIYQCVEDFGGFCNLTTTDLEIRQKYRPPDLTSIDHEVKRLFDPNMILNPGKTL